MAAFGHVTVALALAPIDRDVLRYAGLVRDLGAGKTRFTFVHVLPSADVAAFRPLPGPSRAEAATAMRADIAEHFGPLDGAEVSVRSGDRIDQLLELAAESASDLILVGHRKAGRGRRSVARRLAMKAPASLWMVPEGSPARIERVTVAVDFSLPSANAVAIAARVASNAGLRTCTAVHVHPPSTTSFDGPELTAIERAFDQFLAPLDLHGITVERRVVEGGTVAGAIVQDAIPCDVVVMGTRGLSPSATVLLGSESEEALLDSDVPVLVTKNKGERIGLVRTLLDRGFGWPVEPKFG